MLDVYAEVPTTDAAQASAREWAELDRPNDMEHTDLPRGLVGFPVFQHSKAVSRSMNSRESKRARKAQGARPPSTCERPGAPGFYLLGFRVFWGWCGEEWGAGAQDDSGTLSVFEHLVGCGGRENTLCPRFDLGFGGTGHLGFEFLEGGVGKLYREQTQ